MRRSLLLAVWGASLGILPGGAWAQVIEPMMPLPPLPVSPEAPPQPGEPAVVGKTVTDRARPELDPLGIRFGQFFFFPRFEADEAYNDNIYAVPANKTGDWLTQLMPSFDLVSNFAQNELDVSGGTAIGRYASHSSEDYDDAFGAVNGRIDMTELTHFMGGLRIDRDHEPRTATDAPGNAGQPVTYTTYTGNVGVEQTGTRIGYEADGIVTRSEFEAVPAIGGGIIPQSDRNETGFEGALRGDYEFTPDTQAYIRGAANTQQFDHAAGNGIPIRNSNGYRIDTGLRLDLTGVTYLDAYVGYLQQIYSQSAYGSIEGLDFGAGAVWNFTTLDTLKLNSARTVNNSYAEIGTNGPGTALSPGYLATTSTISEDHELLRNLLLNANASYEVDDWKEIDRTDNVFGIGAGAKYLMSRNLYLGVTWNYQRRYSTGAQAITPYSQNIFLLRLSTQI
jgi:hypothetical protein